MNAASTAGDYVVLDRFGVRLCSVLLAACVLVDCGGSGSSSSLPGPGTTLRSATSATNGSATNGTASSPPASPIDVAPSSLGAAANLAEPQAASPLKVSPTAVALVTAGQTQTLSVSESGYGGTFTLTSSDPTIATVSPVVGGQATVAAVAQGSTSLVVADQLKHRATIRATVGLARLVLGKDRSPATQSIAVTANGQTTSVNLASAPTGCTNFAATCSLFAPEIVGGNTFTLALYDGQNGTGNVLASGVVTAQIASPSSTQSFAVTLDGVVKSLTIALANPTPPPGKAATSAVNITALDADGKPITGAGSYVDASGTKLSVSVSDSDTSGITSIKPKTVSNPTTKVVLSYTGAPLPGGATVTASASGLSPVSAMFLPRASGPKIYVLNTDYTLTTYTADGTPTTPSFTDTNGPNGVTVDAAGKIYLVNGLNNLTTYNADGTPSTPTINGLNVPFGVSVDAAGKIYVANARNNTVTTYNPDGTPSTPTISGLSDPWRMAVDAAGKIYVVNRGNNTVVTYNADGTASAPTITGLKGPIDIAVDAAGKIYVANEGGNTVTTYNPDGTPSTPTISGLNDPWGVAVDAGGKIYIANRSNNTVTTYNSDGTTSAPTITGLNSPLGLAIH